MAGDEAGVEHVRQAAAGAVAGAEAGSEVDALEVSLFRIVSVAHYEQEGQHVPYWTPVALLPNLFAKTAMDGEVVALAPPRDPRVQTFCGAHPEFKVLLSRFTDAFNVPREPVVLIVRDDVVRRLETGPAFQSFRDLAAMSIVPYARALSIVYGNSNRIAYSTSFSFYPWMLARDNKHLAALTPAITSYHVVEAFRGQSSPELSCMELTDVDVPLFDALLVRWMRHYLG